MDRSISARAGLRETLENGVEDILDLLARVAENALERDSPVRKFQISGSRGQGYSRFEE